MRKWQKVSIGILLLSALILAAFLLSANHAGDVQARLITQETQIDASGFEEAKNVRPFVFPDDHGAHPNYQTEWWYYTGNLVAKNGQRFGYQLTFFRRALLPEEKVARRESSWGTNQAYLAHFAITDVQQGKHYAFERLSRGAAGLAGAQTIPFQVWLEDWQVQETQSPLECATTPCTYKLFAAQETVELELTLSDQKGPILQGEQGLSRKGNQTGQASYYYSLTRLKTEGTVKIEDQDYAVNGWSWMDHEFSTSALTEEQIGWDWFSIQFNDNSELMLFQIRRQDGSIDPYSSGTFIADDGRTTRLTQDDFTIQVDDTWKSPHNQAVYPSAWQIQIPSLDLILKIQPLLADQEMNLSYSYWEGSVEIEGQRGQQILSGYGYIELTGYSGSMGGEF